MAGRNKNTEDQAKAECMQITLLCGENGTK